MSYFCDQMDCPVCGGIMNTSMNCNTGEERRICLLCGTTQSWNLRPNKDGTPAVNGAGHRVLDYKEEIGYGSACIAHSVCGIDQYQRISFPKPLYPNEVEELTDKVEKAGRKEKSHIILFDPDKKVMTVAYGAMPTVRELVPDSPEEDSFYDMPYPVSVKLITK